LLETKAELDLVEAWTNFETVILEDFVGQSNGLDKGLNITVQYRSGLIIIVLKTETFFNNSSYEMCVCLIVSLICPVHI